MSSDNINTLTYSDENDFKIHIFRNKQNHHAVVIYNTSNLLMTLILNKQIECFKFIYKYNTFAYRLKLELKKEEKQQFKPGISGEC